MLSTTTPEEGPLLMVGLGVFYISVTLIFCIPTNFNPSFDMGPTIKITPLIFSLSPFLFHPSCSLASPFDQLLMYMCPKTTILDDIAHTNIMHGFPPLPEISIKA